MSMHGSQISWSESQWHQVTEAVMDEAAQARVAASYLPEYGPLPASAEVVPSETLETIDNDCDPCDRDLDRLRVDDVNVTRLLTIQVDIQLTQAQMAEPDLPSALLMFRRAANIVARIEDGLIFQGAFAEDVEPFYDPIAANPSWVNRVVPNVPYVFQVRGWAEVNGVRQGVRGLLDVPTWVQVPGVPPPPAPPPRDYSAGLVTAISDGIAELEGGGQLGPFACTLGNGFFSDANKPVASSLVLPRDRIEPWLGNPLTRTSVLWDDVGVLVSLSGCPIDIVRATPISVQFLQMTLEPRYVFRVYERFALRIKEEDAAVVLAPDDLMAVVTPPSTTLPAANTIFDNPAAVSSRVTSRVVKATAATTTSTTALPKKKAAAKKKAAPKKKAAAKKKALAKKRAAGGRGGP